MNRSFSSRLRGGTAIVLVLGFLALAVSCAPPRRPNFYRSDLNGQLLSTSGNDTELVRAVKVSVAEIRTEGAKRYHAVLFENVSWDEAAFEYQIKWYNDIGLPIGEPGPWTPFKLASKEQRIVPVEEPVLERLHHIEIVVRHGPDD